MPSGSLEVQLGQLDERRAPRASLILDAFGRTIAFDPDREQFVFLPALRPGPGLLSLSYDGTQVLLREYDRSKPTSLGVMALADGGERWFPRNPYEEDEHAVFSPDGTTIAVIGTVDEDFPDDSDDSDDSEDSGGSATVFICLIDARTGERRRIWQGEGAALQAGSGVCWSPDGELIAATHLYWDEELDDDQLATVVIDRSGKELASRRRAHILGASNAAWSSARELLYLDEYDEASTPQYGVMDMATGDVRTSDPYPGVLEGVVAGRRVHRVAEHEAPSAQTEEYYTMAMNGHDRRPLFTLQPRIAPRLHVAPGIFLP